MHQVTDLFAAGTTRIFSVLDAELLIIGFVATVVIFRFVRIVLAPERVLANLSTAPPHLAAVVTLVNSAAPFEIFFLSKFSATFFARLDS